MIDLKLIIYGLVVITGLLLYASIVQDSRLDALERCVCVEEPE